MAKHPQPHLWWFLGAPGSHHAAWPMHGLHAAQRCLDRASFQASSRSWSAVTLFDSWHTEGHNISLQLFFLPCWLGLQDALRAVFTAEDN